jgi:3-oxoacyl-[acyl-carrier protein] reductase
MDLELTDKVAIVTGASRGIGAACALHLAKEGAAVVVNYVNDAASALLTVEGIQQLGGKALLYRADVTKYEEVEAMAAAALAEFGRLDILVNNAGISTHTRGIEGTTTADIDKCIAVNVNGVLNCIKAVTPYMKVSCYGKIINIVSYRAYAPQLPSPYATSKAATLLLSIEAARELAPFNINVVSVSPGMVATDMLKERAGSAEEFHKLEARVPIGRLATPDDVADLVCFLASERARHITGTDILITGGEMPRW